MATLIIFRWGRGENTAGVVCTDVDKARCRLLRVVRLENYSSPLSITLEAPNYNDLKLTFEKSTK